MWIRCPNGLDTLVPNEDHVKRLLSEGGIEIADPTQQAQLEPIATVFEPESIEPIETVFDPIVTDLETDTSTTGDESTTRKRGRSAKQ